MRRPHRRVARPDSRTLAVTATAIAVAAVALAAAAGLVPTPGARALGLFPAGPVVAEHFPVRLAEHIGLGCAGSQPDGQRLAPGEVQQPGTGRLGGASGPRRRDPRGRR